VYSTGATENATQENSAQENAELENARKSMESEEPIMRN